MDEDAAGNGGGCWGRDVDSWGRGGTTVRGDGADLLVDSRLVMGGGGGGEAA